MKGLNVYFPFPTLINIVVRKKAQPVIPTELENKGQLNYNLAHFINCITYYLLFLIGVFGGLDLHGIERPITWTKLSVTVASGSRTVTLVDPVDWVAGEDIVIAPTGYSAWETEIMKITAVSNGNRTLTLNGTLKHTHLGR